MTEMDLADLFLKKEKNGSIGYSCIFSVGERKREGEFIGRAEDGAEQTGKEINRKGGAIGRPSRRVVLARNRNRSASAVSVWRAKSSVRLGTMWGGEIC
jgi:hypothetical protein